MARIPMREQQHQVSCTDGCGRTLLDAETAGRSGWHSLQITGRWRCPACARELASANAPGNHPPIVPLEQLP